jgi:predicted deacetylase
MNRVGERSGSAVAAPEDRPRDVSGPRCVRSPRVRAGAVTGHGALAVALHDVEPSTFERCALIRDWLDDIGVERVTLLVIPAPQLHPFPARSPALANWLLDRVDAGDAVAQHGLQHRRTRPPARLSRPLRTWQGGKAAEYPGLDAVATIASVEAGRRVLVDAGLQPRGFVAPAYAYTAPLREHLAQAFDWWATLLALKGGARTSTPALCFGTSGPLKRAVSPVLVRSGAALSGKLLRLDLHPADFDHPRHVLAVERVLRRARERTAVTYDDLC